MGRNRGWATTLAACSLMSSAWGSTPKLTLLLPHILADPTPVHVEAPPTPETRTDYLEWRTRGAVYRLPMPRVPNAPARRQFLCYTHAIERRMGQMPLFDWREGYTLTPLPSMLSVQGVGVLFIGNLQGGYEFVRQIAHTPVSFRSSPRWQLQAEAFPLVPLYLRPQQLPDEPLALLGVPFIVLAEGAEQLSAAQWRALILWMHSGGQLIVSLNASASLLRRTPLARYLPDWDALRMQRLTQAVRISPAGSVFPPPSEPVPLAPLRATDAEQVAQIGERNALVAQIPYGFGRLVVFGGDLTHPAWRNWHGYLPLWQALLRNPRFAGYTVGRLLGDSPRSANAQAVRTPLQMLLLVGLFTAYWFVLYGLWRVLRVRRQLVYAPYGVLGCVLLALLGLHWLVPPPLEHNAISGKRVLVGTLSTASALERGRWFYHSPASDWSLRWDGADALAVDAATALNPVQVTFEGSGATLRGWGLTPTTLEIHTWRMQPIPLRVRRTKASYELVNTSTDITFERIQVARYKHAPLGMLEDEASHDALFESPLELDWEPYHGWALAPGGALAFPFEPSTRYLVWATARVENARTQEQVEVWLFLP